MSGTLTPWIRRLGGARRAGWDLLFPPRCGCCGADVAPTADGSAPLCQTCRSSLRLIDWPVCPRCAAALPDSGGEELPCIRCRDVKLRFDRTLALGSYEGLFRRWVLHLKGDRSGLAARTLAALTWERLGTNLAALGVDVVAPVPMHPWRRWLRGVDPPRDLAEQIARRLGVPAAPRILRQLRNIPPQIGLTRAGRFRNVTGEMAVRPGYLLQSAHVLLVDDILTTGATASEAARRLKMAGAREVTVLVLARTPANG